MNFRRIKDLNRRDWFRRLAEMKEQPKPSPCRAWIALLNNRWHWSNPSTPRLPNPFRN
jgi:hypothetical protein